MSEEEIINRLKELSQETGNELLIPTNINQEDVSYTESNTIEESTSVEETTSGGDESVGESTTG